MRDIDRKSLNYIISESPRCCGLCREVSSHFKNDFSVELTWTSQRVHQSVLWQASAHSGLISDLCQDHSFFARSRQRAQVRLQRRQVPR